MRVNLSNVSVAPSFFGCKLGFVKVLSTLISA